METLFIRARSLRRDMPPAERAVWALLRARGLGGWKFRRQVPIGPYIVDFLCKERRLVLEIDGLTHDARVEHDRKRDAFIRAQGYRVVRLCNDNVYDNLEGVMWKIMMALNE